MIQEQLLLALVRSKNEAADDVLLEALRLGDERERVRALDALVRRRTVRGLSGVVGLFDRLPDPVQRRVLADIKAFHPALREAGRSDDPAVRTAAMRLVARGRQGRLAYVLTENLHDAAEPVSRAAADALVGLAKWVADESRALQRGAGPAAGDAGDADDADDAAGDVTGAAADDRRAAGYAALMDQRPEVEAAVARALDVHRGRHGPELLRAALLLCDGPGTRAFGVLTTPKHGGQMPMVRRLQQPPAAEHVEAFLLGAARGHVRSHFGAAFAHLADAPALDAVLRRTHWLADPALRQCARGVIRGAWWADGDLNRDLSRRPPADAARIADWVVASGAPDATQDDRLDTLYRHARDDFGARLRLLRAAAGRPRGASAAPLVAFLADPDERLARMAAREVVRRRPPEFENVLLRLMAGAPESVRRVIGRAVGQVGFDHFWGKFDRLDPATRRSAGRAMLKLLPDAPKRLRRRLLAAGGPADGRVKALRMVHELGLADDLRDAVLALCRDPDPRVRSKAAVVAGEAGAAASGGGGGDAAAVAATAAAIDRLLGDADPRVRANAIEVVEARRDARLVPLLAERARSAAGRERANAIKALFAMRVEAVSGQLFHMLRDHRPEHRISGMWALRQVGWWQLLGEVGRMAKADENIRVRRYALQLLQGVAELAAAGRAARAGEPAAAVA